MSYHISSNGSAGGCFPALPLSCGIKPLTCTIFDPTYFCVILRNHISHISPTRLKSSIMGNYLDFGLKIGATQAHKRARESCFVCLKSIFVQYFYFFSVFAVWHNAIFATKRQKILLFFFQIKK